jgi:hypothetical protein
MVKRPPYIFYRGSVFTITGPKLYPRGTPLLLQPYSCCDVEVLALNEQGRDFGANGGCVLCTRRRGHGIRKVVPLTWKKYFNYEKNERVQVMSMTVLLSLIKVSTWINSKSRQSRNGQPPQQSNKSSPS